ncbi:MAG: hypothetical protein COB53_06190 [Elusimicrobia bacterium]|nr:MAG: hypothetical protein COB53_06190 [Elusimicrobiota bacterium]
MEFRPVIADVHYSSTDGTYYVLNQFEIGKSFIAQTVEETKQRLHNGGWSRCGKVVRHDDEVVEMWSSDSRFIAIWDPSVQPVKNPKPQRER